MFAKTYGERCCERHLCDSRHSRHFRAYDAVPCLLLALEHFCLNIVCFLTRKVAFVFPKVVSKHLVGMLLRCEQSERTAPAY